MKTTERVPVPWVRIPPHPLLRLLIWSLSAASLPCPTDAQEQQPTHQARQAVLDAFVEVHDGWSSDEVLLQDELNEQFLRACRARTLDLTPFQCNWSLLALRKSGKLHVEVTRRRHDRHDAYAHAAEIAARWVEDQFGVNTDRALCDPKTRQAFDEKAQTIAPDVEPYLLRKAALSLRKARKLQPEYVARVADWGREIRECTVGELQNELAALSGVPGVYVFRDASGYLYIGEAADLAARLAQHLAESDRQSLAGYLARQGVARDKIVVEVHRFDPESAGRLVTHRRAYESDLISRRQPRFNVRP